MKNPKLIIGSVVVLVIIIIVGFNIINDAATPAEYDEFAKCLSDSGVKIYGAYWCPHCKSQKELFGKSWKYVNYIECSLPNKSGQTQECREANIGGYPTWEFQDGKRVAGEISFKELSQQSGCELGE